MLGANCARFELQTESASKTMQNAYEINAEQDAVDQSVVLAQGSMTHVSCDYHFHHSSSAKQPNMEHGETHCEESRLRRHKVIGVTSISVQLCLAAVCQLWSARMEGWFLSRERCQLGRLWSALFCLLLTTKAGDTGIENTAMKETGYIEM